MKIVVLMKQVPDTYEERRIDLATGLLDRAASDPVADEINERALEVALSHKDSHKGTEVVVLTMGPEGAKTALKKGLQMGADSGVHIEAGELAGADAVQTAKVLANALRETGFDLIVAGNESTDGRGGVVPAMVSELLGVPLLGSLGQVEISEGSVRGERREDGGTSTVSASLPALVSVTENVAEARFPNFKGIMTAKRKPIADVPASGAGSAASTVAGISERPARAAGVKIVDSGDAGVQLAAFLASGRLI
ncbi:electron transfer flavoprotein subunit beta/FixA family protein [Arthrobacter ginkgonis]|uniref:Electron transfer flavoprotein subunit beta n=1 Tax=Arthrobacter ginkgonis TaxID=1630594 RepID=A0ABP7BS96_9MICC